MPNSKNPGAGQHATHERGGNHEKQAGQQEHGGSTMKSSFGRSERGGSHEQHVKAGEQSHKNS